MGSISGLFRMCVGATSFVLLGPGALSAQQDSLPVPRFHLDEIVVVADRSGSPVRETVASTTLLTRADIERLPAHTLPDVLRSVPGLVFVESDGSGRLPMAIARGFFGGGETSYVLLTVDGIPVNDDRTGLVEWTQIPLSEIERVEVLRGSASVAYGDAALGAVVNVVTRDANADEMHEMSVRGGSWGGRGMQGSLAQRMAGGRLRASVDVDAEDGFRSHSRSSRTAASVSFARIAGDGRDRTFGRLSYGRISNQEPGPLSPSARTQDPLQSSSMFSADERVRNLLEVTGGSSRLGTGGQRLDLDFRLRYSDQERTRTLLLAPSFGDTQRQHDRDLSGWARTQYSLSFPWGELRAGGEAETSAFRNRYRDPSTGNLLAQDRGARTKLAAHAELRRDLVPRLSLHTGLRYDHVLSTLDGAADVAGRRTSFGQWSPRFALNFAYMTRSSAPGNLFLTWTRAFKAPTLDQLYDSRAIPTGQPDQTVSLSNRALKPQRSWAVEGGAYQRFPLGDSGRFAELSAGVYRQELDDEIDFDIRTFRYGNIQRSRHTGLEASVRTVLSSRLEIDHAATLTRATFRSSELEGNQLKNIPKTAFVTTVHLGLTPSVRLSLTHRATGSAYVDDENTSKLGGSNLLDAALAWRRGPLEAAVSALNVFDRRYDSFGYLLYDPIQQADVRMVHPAPGRRITLTFTVRGQ